MDGDNNIHNTAPRMGVGLTELGGRGQKHRVSVGAAVLVDYLSWVIGQEEVERPEHRETVRGTEAESNIAAVVERQGERVLQLGGPRFASWASLCLNMDKVIPKVSAYESFSHETVC